MNEIKPTYVSFEQAKRLKEKGFDLYLNAIYKTDGTLVENVNLTKVEKLFPAPEQWQVVEWLRVKHGIWVSVDVVKEYWFWKIRGINGKEIVKEQLPIELCTTLTDLLFSNTKYLKYTSPQEAYSAAFDYILTNII